MEQDVRYVGVDGGRVAYATCGEGPPIVFAPPWVCHLEEDWADPEARSFFLELARTHRVVRFDRIGCGLSSRELDRPLSLEHESRQLEAVTRTVGEPAVIFATCSGGVAASHLAARSPELVSKLVYFGGYASRGDIPDRTRSSLVEFTRSNWPLAAQLLAGLIDPRAGGDDIRRYSRLQRAAATAEVAAGLLDLDLTADVRDLLPRVQAPALVVHRRGDRAVPIARGRELAGLLPNARFVPLSGEAHLPWCDDRREVLRALAVFLHEGTPLELDEDSPLTGRETEVLRLVATGMSNREIASTLVLSEHTVHRHVANILRKLSQSTRAAAATQAMRAGMI